MRISALIFILTLILFTSCSQGSEETQTASEEVENRVIEILDTTKVIKEKPKTEKQKDRIKVGSILSKELDLSKIQCMPQAYARRSMWSHYSPGTISKKSVLYDSMDSTNAKVIDTLTFDTPINILSEFKTFYLVCTPFAIPGYIKKEDVFFQSYGISRSKGKYYFGIDNGKLKVTMTNNEQEIISQLIDNIGAEDYEVKKLYDSALKNADVFHISFHYYSGVGVEENRFVIDTDNKLSELLATFSSGDGGYADIMNAYLPIKLTNGEKVVLAKNGTLTINQSNGKTELYEYPEDCGIPIDELIVVESYTSEMIWDDETSNPATNEDGTMLEKNEILETIYYQWDGKALSKIKSIKNPLYE